MILLLLLGLGLILAGANYLTDGAAALAQQFRVPEFVIGLTVVAIGTSAPELVVSLLSSVAGNSDVALGNVVGSNVFNTFVILGVCALVRPVALTRGNICRDIPYGVAVSLLLLLVTSDRMLGLGPADRISHAEGAVMLALYVLLLWRTVRTAPRPPRTETHAELKPLWLTVAMVVGGLVGLVAGGNLFLDGATRIARALGVGESVIAITLVAGGTSLPELAAAVVSLVKGKTELALGNVVGSNIANILLILGLSATIRPLEMGGIAVTDILVVLLGSLALLVTAFTFRRRAIDRVEGVLFLIAYGAYIWTLVR